MRFEGPQVKAPPLSRRRMRPPTPLHNSYSSFEEEQELRENRGHFSMNKWESEKPKNWGMPAEGFKGHDATDGFLLGTA